MPDGHVAFYARVSTEGQARDNTIASQITALRERIAAEGGQLEPDDAYVDEGYSGSVLFVRRWNGCATRLRRGASGEFMSSLPTGWPGVMHIRRF